MARTIFDKMKQYVHNATQLPEPILTNLVKGVFNVLNEEQKQEDIVCGRCGSVNCYRTEKAGPHIKAICNGCDRYIKFLPQGKNELTQHNDFDTSINLNKNSNQMAADKIIHGRVNVDAIDKKWLYKGEKGTYLDFTMFYTEEQDQYQNNGMITQSVPNEVFKKEKDLPKEQRSKGAILGNCKEFSKLGNREESSPGYTGAKTSKPANATKKEEDEDNEETEAADDDLPF